MNIQTEGDSPDLSICADEPIHVPGSIQPHGVLLAFSKSDMRVVWASDNVNQLIGLPYEQLLGQSIELLLGELQLRTLTDSLIGDDVESLNPYRLRILSRPEEKEFDAVIHRVDDLVIIELEPPETELSVNALEFFRTGYLATSQSLNCCSKAELLNTLATFTRTITGFDRVMVYLFEPDWSGCVVAESRRGKMDSYMGNYFPASDIPAQARALYRKNRLRLFVDVNARASLIHHDRSVEADKPLDLSKSILRSMSPVHTEYLKNMQVEASLSISLIGKNDELRGLVACHHAAPRYVSYQQRAACDFLAQLGSLKLAELEMQETFDRRAELQENLKNLLLYLDGQQDLSDRLISSGDLLLDVCGATGVAVVSADRCLMAGATPDRQKLSALVDFLKKNTEGAVFSTDSLSKYGLDFAAYKSVASGLLAIKTSETGNRWVLWFRPERVAEINWAGRPHKAVEIDHADGMRVHPRKSFQSWKQEVVGESLPWSEAEIESVMQLRITILEKALAITQSKRKEQLQQQMEELKLLNLQLEANATQLNIATNDAQQASQRKSEMVSIVSHDLRGPLASIRGALALMTNGVLEVSAEARQVCETAHNSSSYLLELITNLLNLDSIESGTIAITRAETPLNGLFQRARTLLSTEAEAAGVELRPIATDIVLNIDPDRILQVLVNLVSNAIKFSPRGGFIELSAAALSGEVLIKVKDQGRGVPDEFRETIFRRFAQVSDSDRSEKGGTGLGLAICKALVEGHGGTIGVDSVGGQGSTFWLKLPTKLN